MKTLYLHVGTHKTGTTSFQQFLFDNRDRKDILKFWSHVGEIRIVDYDEAMKSDGEIINALLRTIDIACPQGTSHRLNQRVRGAAES